MSTDRSETSLTHNLCSETTISWCSIVPRMQDLLETEKFLQNCVN
jgi:hypothetical protein